MAKGGKNRGAREQPSSQHLVSSKPPTLGAGGAHVSKRRQASSGLEIVFDPAHHREFLTGFSKRKKQRRKEAMKNLEKLEREDRLAVRAERRRAKKLQGVQKTDEALPLKASDDELDEGEVETGGKAREAAEAGGQPEPSVRVYKGETTTTTVTLVHIRNSSSESDGAVAAGDQSEDEDGNDVKGGRMSGTAQAGSAPSKKTSKRSKLLAHLKEKRSGKARQPHAGAGRGGGVAKRGGGKGQHDDRGGKGAKGKGGGKGKGGKGKKGGGRR